MKHRNVTLGTRLELDCNAKSDENVSVQYTWYTNWELVSNSTRMTVDPEHHSLIIYSTTVKDTGKYKCIAETDYDRAEITIAVTVIGDTRKYNSYNTVQ